MARRLLRLLAVLLIVAGSGIPRAVLQGYAWGAMIASTWTSVGLKQAAAEAVSGRAPCRICLKAAAIGAARGPALISPSAPSLEVVLSGKPAPVGPSAVRFRLLPDVASAQSSFRRIPVPPPRIAA